MKKEMRSLLISWIMILRFSTGSGLDRVHARGDRGG